MAPMTKSLNKVLWWPVESQDAVEHEYLDQIDKNAQTFKDLDVKPADIANFTFQYLQHYRSSAYYDLPPMTEREKREGWSIPAKVCVGVVKQTFSSLSSGVEFLQLIQAGRFLGAHPKEVANSPNSLLELRTALQYIPLGERFPPAGLYGSDTIHPPSLRPSSQENAYGRAHISNGYPRTNASPSRANTNTPIFYTVVTRIAGAYAMKRERATLFYR
ncbi:Protein-lysine N-methyltransferase efm5 [Friedmanniomyces endolithicus]|nr:Protein-lysine N-methyltransferase efm5 [Friedmanniomyces endolithicus]